MQYANVIIDHRAGFEPLTYAIPAELLAHVGVGSVVVVPFGHQTVHGVVDSFIRRVDNNLASKLKPVTSVVYPQNCVEACRLEAAHYLHKTWGLSLGHMLFKLLPELPKRSQTTPSVTPSGASTYQLAEYQIPINRRVEWYKKVFGRLKKQQKSLLVICSNALSAQVLGEKLQAAGIQTAIYPENITPKERREFWLASFSPSKPTVFIGTRGALVTSLHSCGAVAIDEPWLPGHKDDASPKLWSIFIANALCRAHKIPLLTVSSLLWPETRLLQVKKSHRVEADRGEIRLTPRRALAEQLDHWLAETEGLTNRTIVVHESKYETIWCSTCKKVSTDAHTCPTCGSTPTILPRIDESAVHEALGNETANVVTTEQSWLAEPTQAILAINFDTYLAITDFRASLYLGTLLFHLNEQSPSVFLGTNHPDTWTHLIEKLTDDYVTQELNTRQAHSLPPYALLIRLTAPQTDILEKLLPITLDDVINVGKVHRAGDHVALTILLKPQSKIPPEWTKKSLFKIDILPLYFDS